MNDMLVVNFAAMQTAGENIDTAIRTLNDQLSQLERDVAPLIATWDGDAKAAYEARQRQWRSAAGELCAMLIEIKKALHESTLDYRDTEQRNVRLFQ